MTALGPARDPKGWIVCPQPRPDASVRLVCLPFAGGGTLTFRGWQAELPDHVEVCAVQLPGRERRIRERPLASVETLVPALATALESELDRTCVFLGHSMGGLLAFEVARELRRRGGVQPAKLIASGRQAPPIPEPDPPVHALPDAEFLVEVSKHGGTPAEVLANPELLELVLPVLRADFQLCETYSYRPEPPLELPITAFGGETDSEVPLADLAAWERETTAAFRLATFPGGHFFVQTDREAYLRELGRELDEFVG